MRVWNFEQIRVFIISISLLFVNSGQLDIYEDTSVVSVWPGNDVILECGDDHLESVRRFWKKGDELLTAADIVMSDDDRIKQINNSATLVITNVNKDDKGEYICVVNAKPRYKHVHVLRIKEVMCEVQDQPLNGFYKNETPTGGLPYKTGDRIRYFCNKGYHLLGTALRTCSGSTKQWSPEEPPFCEPEFIARLRQQIKGFESKMEVNIFNVSHQMMTLRNQLPPPFVNRSANTLLNGTVEKELAEWFWESCHNKNNYTTNWNVISNSSLGVAGNKRVFLVSEYKWVVENIRGRVKLLTSAVRETQESPAFYSTVPGYRFKLKFTLYHTSDFYLNLLIVKGDFDGQLKWPARIKYDLYAVMQNGTEVLYKYFNPSISPGCLPKRPPPDVSASCTAARLAQSNDFYTQKKYISDDESITFKAYIYV
ncbi:hypothetical protein CHUAL_007627 [Chamberlinius hualienensis]